ncbi:DUF1343 domain-containing protein [Gangjinia marincola]|uniref:DUF1343 domain-containing protein n=2 Tax=Gangjinia marincola TaxID=578463 RepID=A0ABN1MDS8_9FLAO
MGAHQLEEYLHLLEGKRVGVVANQTSVIFHTEKQQQNKIKIDAQGNPVEIINAVEEVVIPKHTHLVDSLLSCGVKVKKVFAPEHGFRGKADAGEVVKDGIDKKTGLPIISLYGKNKKPSPAMLQNIDVVIFDIQDVGARFYTYISSLHYVMEACAENNIPLIVLDRPNPNGHYIDGPILEKEYKSFVGMHPIPVVHGMTIAEYAQLINGEKWLKNGVQAKLHLIKMPTYDRKSRYSLPIKPSPNLPNDQAISLYPSVCFFEGTNINAGRGTAQQFQVFGSPFLNPKKFTYTYTPQPNEGAAHPKHKATLCYGKQLMPKERLSLLNLEYLIDAYNHTADKKEFFNDFFTKLAGTKTLQQQIEQGYTTREIRKTWFQGLQEFEKTREKYLLY